MNGNGRLDAGDARWADFKVWVNGNLVTLASLGIVSIELTPSGSGQTFADGSAITGLTSFTRADGSTGTAGYVRNGTFVAGVVGDAVLAGDDAAYKIERTSTTQADGSKIISIIGRNLGGGSLVRDCTLAFSNYTLESADGKYKVTAYDDDGNGVIDLRQRDNLAVNDNGVVNGNIAALAA